jgi:hypothetical protein
MASTTDDGETAHCPIRNVLIQTATACVDDEGCNRHRMTESKVDEDCTEAGPNHDTTGAAPPVHGRLDSLAAVAEERLGHDLAEPIKMIRDFGSGLRVQVDEVLKGMYLSTSKSLRQVNDS